MAQLFKTIQIILYYFILYYINQEKDGFKRSKESVASVYIILYRK